MTVIYIYIYIQVCTCIDTDLYIYIYDVLNSIGFGDSIQLGDSVKADDSIFQFNSENKRQALLGFALLLTAARQELSDTSDACFLGSALSGIVEVSRVVELNWTESSNQTAQIQE